MKILWIALTVAALGATTWFLTVQSAASREDQVTGDSHEPRSESPIRKPSLGTNAPRAGNAKRLLEEERRRYEKAARLLEEAKRELAARTVTADAKALDDAAKKAEARFSFPATAEVIDTVDWREAGEAITKIGPLMVEFADSLAAGT
ncbi:MAG: hypothetical protein GY953_09510, partial [bacterium]|nr:hypothetical protein [bacterium]